MKIDAKKKKLLIGGGCLAVAILGGSLLAGGDKAPVPPPPLTAKEALAQAQARLAAQKGRAVVAPHPAVNSAQPAPVSSAQTPAAAASAAVVVAPAAAGSTTTAMPASAVSPVASAPTQAVSTSAPAQPEPVEVQPALAKAQVPAPVTAPAPALVPAVAPAPVRPVASAPVVAGTAKPQVGGATDYTGYYESLADLQRQVSVMELRAKIVDLQRKIDGTPSDGQFPPPAASPVTVMPPPTQTGAVIPSLAVPDAVPTDPQAELVSTMMVAGKYQAVVRTGGAPLTVEEGSVLSDGWSVVAIGPGSVSLVRGRKHKTIRVGG